MSVVKDSKGDEVDKKRLLVTTTASVFQLGYLFDIIEHAATKKTPWSLVEPIESLGQQIHDGSKFMLVPTWGQFNYSIIEILDYIRHTFDITTTDFEVNILSTKRAAALFIITIPAAERLNALLHVLVGHELGHPFEKSYLAQEVSTQLWKEEMAQIDSGLDTFHSGQPGWDQFSDLQRMQIKLNELARVQRLRSDALSELISDLVCVQLFGFSGVLGIERLGWIGPLDDVSDDIHRKNYPPSRYRIRKAIQELRNSLGNIEFPNELSEEVLKAAYDKIIELDGLVAIDSDLQALKKNAYVNLAYDSVERSWVTVRDWIIGSLQAHRFNLGSAHDNFSALLVTRQLDFIPPDVYVSDGVEIPAELYSIMLSGWLVWLAKYQDGPVDPEDPGAYLQAVDAQFRLVLKAIEYSYLRKSWNSPESDFVEA